MIVDKKVEWVVAWLGCKPAPHAPRCTTAHGPSTRDGCAPVCLKCRRWSQGAGGGFMRRRAAGCGLHAVRAWTRVGLSRSYGHRVQAGGIVVKPRTMKWRFRLETRRLHTQASSLHLPYLSHLNSFQSHSYSCRRNSAFFHSSAWHPKVARPSRRRPAISPG